MVDEIDRNINTNKYERILLVQCFAVDYYLTVQYIEGLKSHHLMQAVKNEKHLKGKLSTKDEELISSTIELRRRWSNMFCNQHL